LNHLIAELFGLSFEIEQSKMCIAIAKVFVACAVAENFCNQLPILVEIKFASRPELELHLFGA